MRIREDIRAPREIVYQTIANPSHYSKAVPDIKEVEFLSETTAGVGTRFRETREMFGKEVATELEISESVENECVRFVSEAGGTLWDSCFSLAERDGGTELTLVMEAKTSSILARLMNLLMAGMIKKAVGRDMAAVKAHCEDACKAD